MLLEGMFHLLVIVYFKWQLKLMQTAGEMIRVWMREWLITGAMIVYFGIDLSEMIYVSKNIKSWLQFCSLLHFCENKKKVYPENIVGLLFN